MAITIKKISTEKKPKKGNKLDVKINAVLELVGNVDVNKLDKIINELIADLKNKIKNNALKEILG